MLIELGIHYRLKRCVAHSFTLIVLMPYLTEQSDHSVQVRFSNTRGRPAEGVVASTTPSEDVAMSPPSQAALPILYCQGCAADHPAYCTIMFSSIKHFDNSMLIDFFSQITL